MANIQVRGVGGLSEGARGLFVWFAVGKRGSVFVEEVFHLNGRCCVLCAGHLEGKWGGYSLLSGRVSCGEKSPGAEAITRSCWRRGACLWCVSVAETKCRLVKSQAPTQVEVRAKNSGRPPLASEASPAVSPPLRKSFRPQCSPGCLTSCRGSRYETISFPVGSPTTT
ncbi:hypothetical protein P171DRAFT_196876 [Karstenula rhodostoma CBS 690.94]|uniref:Uncharacterized protein n=1 Tax=Karstenula rhodostoma CBS 690.94 TaxID=1392251 RepID=A0A9P4UGY8_9PLEO|nr:hypothetical protein P171DRAFT_196876 [Karstenula rhodostoma CBS 690.94]